MAMEMALKSLEEEDLSEYYDYDDEDEEEMEKFMLLVPVETMNCKECLL